ncbi:MAG TPA: Fic family protein [Gemmatimonadaceae bacterium]|nr:Fic family protein [Gemmatimonadaceae bacterium]
MPTGQPSTPVTAGDTGTPGKEHVEEGRDEYPPLTKSAVEVRSLVRQPLSVRNPVGYNPAFLESYLPGTTWYLTTALRAHLNDTGRTPDGPRPAGTYAREILGRLLIDLSWGSSRLEGNTYSRLDTKNLIEFGQRAEGKDAWEAQMILNHRAAIELLVEQAEHIGFNRYTFLNLHALLSENLLDDPGDEGGLRQRLVGIEGSAYTPPGVPQKIQEWFDLSLEKAAAIPDPFEQAFFVMVQLPYLQPFADVNKRTSRIAANIPLIRANLFPLSFVDVPKQAYIEGLLAIYEFNRIELLRDVFVWAYDRSVKQYRVVSDAMGQPDPLRLQYRAELREVVSETVRAGRAPERTELRQWAELHGVQPGDAEGFANRALDLLLGLHEGNLARYRLLPSEFQAWRSRHAAASRS